MPRAQRLRAGLTYGAATALWEKAEAQMAARSHRWMHEKSTGLKTGHYQGKMATS